MTIVPNVPKKIFGMHLLWMGSVGFGLRLIWTFSPLGAMYGRDMEPYRALALDLWHHGWWPGGGGIVNTYWSPLTVTLLSPLYGVNPDSEALPRIVYALLASLIPVFISMTTRLLVTRPDVALLAGWLSVFLPVNLLFAGSLSSEVPSNLFAVMALWLLMKGVGPGSTSRSPGLLAFASGLLLGCSVLTRAGNAPLIAVFWTVPFFFFRKKGMSVGGVLKTSVLLLLGVIILTVPRATYVSHVEGAPQLTQSGGAYNLYFGTNEWTEGVNRDEPAAMERWRAAVEEITRLSKAEQELEYLHRSLIYLKGHFGEYVTRKTVQTFFIRYSGWAGTQGFREGGKRLLFIVGFIVLNGTTLLWVVGVFILMGLPSVSNEIKLLVLGWFLVTWLSVMWFPSPNPFRYGMALDNVACIAVAMVYGTLYLPKKGERGIL
jgi:hypothetical protein